MLGYFSRAPRSHRNPPYHRPTDTPDKLDFDSMASVTTGLAQTLAALTH
jgi:hypothetical protein